MTLLIDNYDSFTFNLYQLIEELGAACVVHRNDQLTIPEIEQMRPARIVISPGPGGPHEAGISAEVIRHFGSETPIFGVCLGHQVIGDVFGARVQRAKVAKHGKMSRVMHDGLGVFSNVPNPFTATRYHSLVVEPEGLPQCLEVSARTEDGIVMGIRHRQYPIEGVQFHPESIATEGGRIMLGNFLKM